MRTRLGIPGRSALAVVILLPFATLPALAQHHGGAGAGSMRGMGQMMGMRHDSTDRAHMAVIHELVMNHQRINRSVTNLPSGIRTVTESDDSLLAARIKEHVVTMYARIESGKDPGWPMESEALKTLYANKALIRAQIDSTPKGIVITQTSGDTATVSALQKHATEVTALVTGGRSAMHAAMMQRRGGMMMMHGTHAHPDSAAGRRPDPPGHAGHRPPR